MDYLIRGLLKDRKVRFLAIRNTECINEAISIKKPSDVVIALLGRTLAVGSMMGYMNKEDDAKISIRIQGTGKAELVIVDANTKGEVRGYVKNPYVFLPLKSNGHLDVGRSIGKGMITVIKDLGLKEPFHSEINIQSGEIGDDFSYYFAVSEQTPSVVGVGVLVDKDYSCKIGGGFIVQMLPDATDDDYVFVDEVTRKVTSVTDLLLKYDNLEELMTSLFGELEYVEELKNAGQTVLDGERTFKLYDTYGFPLELTEEILAENGMTADKEGFAENMQKQKDLARSSRKSTEDEAWKDSSLELNVPETVFKGYETLTANADVLALIAHGELAESATEGDKVIVILNETPFYAEGGGQATDTGFISNDSFAARIESVEKKDGVFYHTVNITKGELKVGDSVFAMVDTAKRHSTARNHTATHLLQKALRKVVGTHVEQAGSSVNEKVLRFDFSHFEAVTKQQLAEVEKMVNDVINEFLVVDTKEMSMAEAQEAGAMALFGEKYGEKVRVVNAGGWSIELCGGTHVANTGEIGAFKILSESGVASGVRRIEAVTGTGVLAEAHKAEEVVAGACEALKCNKTVLVEKVKSVSEELKALKKELEEMKKAQMGSGVDQMVADAPEFNGVKLITKEFQDANINDLRGLSDDIKAAHKGIAMVFAAVNGEKVTFMVSLTDDVVEKGYHAGKMIKEVAAAAGGGGGGKADMAQAGAKDVTKIKDAFEVAKNLLS